MISKRSMRNFLWGFYSDKRRFWKGGGRWSGGWGCRGRGLWVVVVGIGILGGG